MNSLASLPERIGPFRILRLLGEGGMGRVFLAQQEQPQREVALKVIQSIASAGYQARFQREAELLAGLEHPGIARIYAAGSADTATGPVPYLAMEYVRGTDLLAYSSTRPLAEKVRLLADVCRAVHYAHTRGVIHRDLKPGNILVDERGQPKVLDFGVARAMGDEALTNMTAAGEILGTLPYMSWEQLTGEPGRLDPRSDVYSLGAIAYELMAGQMPYPGLSKATLLSAIETVRTGDPQRLSRVAPEAAGDLETMVMKALAREPARRYGSAAELAADLERYLVRQPITARPPTARYVLGLFVRRHRALTAGAALALAAIVAGSVIALRFAVAEGRARVEAESRLAERDAVNGFMNEMLSKADPYQADGKNLTLRQMLDRARDSLATSSLPPFAAAQVYRTIGTAYANFGLNAEALAAFEEAGKRSEGLALVDIQVEKAKALISLGRLDESEALILPLLDALPPATGDAQRLRIEARFVRSSQLLQRGRMEDALKWLDELDAEAQATLSPDHTLVFWTSNQRATAASVLDRPDAVSLFQALIERRSARSPRDHPDLLFTLSALAYRYRRQGEFAKSEVLSREVLEARGRIFGEDYFLTGHARGSLAAALLLQGRAAEAEPMARSSYQAVAKHMGFDHWYARDRAAIWLGCLAALGRSAEAEAEYRKLIAAAEQQSGGPHPYDFELFSGYGDLLLTEGRVAESLAQYERLLQHAQRKYAADHSDLAIYRSGYAEVLTRAGRHAEARRELEAAHEVLLRKQGAESYFTRQTAARLARVSGPA